jgi:hypothetical protein
MDARRCYGNSPLPGHPASALPGHQRPTPARPIDEVEL